MWNEFKANISDAADRILEEKKQYEEKKTPWWTIKVQRFASTGQRGETYCTPSQMRQRKHQPEAEELGSCRKTRPSLVQWEKRGGHPVPTLNQTKAEALRGLHAVRPAGAGWVPELSVLYFFVRLIELTNATL